MKFARFMTAAVLSAGLVFAAVGCGASERDICETAKRLISEKCAEMDPEHPAACISVELLKKVSDNFWTARAKLDNGTVIPITIKLYDDDRIEIDFSAWIGKQIEKEFDEAGKELRKELEKADREFRKELEKADREFRKELDKADREFQKELDNLQ